MDMASILEFVQVLFADFDIMELVNVLLGVLGGIGA